MAPTGSGKTLAAFLWSLDRLLTSPAEPAPGPSEAGAVDERAQRCKVLYVSPLKALAADVERNLRSPWQASGRPQHDSGPRSPTSWWAPVPGTLPRASGDGSGSLPGHPDHDPRVPVPRPDLPGAGGADGVQTVIIDEIHAVAGTKRGAHLAVSLERLDALLPAPAQRVGLSATVRPVEAVATFLAGHRRPEDQGREVVVVQPPSEKKIEVDIVVPVPDLSDLRSAPAPRGTTGGAAPGDLPPLPDGEPDLSGRPPPPAAPVGVAARRGARGGPRGRAPLDPGLHQLPPRRRAPHGADERGLGRAAGRGRAGRRDAPALADRGTVRNERRDGTRHRPRAPRVHEPSRAHPHRDRAQDGRLPAVVATSSLELGIDMGAIDLVVQVGAPLGRERAPTHRARRPSGGCGVPRRAVPHLPGDLVPSAVIADRMRTGQIEHLHVLSNPLDVLAQQVVAMVALDDWTVAELAALVRRSAPYGALGDATLHAVLDMLAGRYPSEDFGELRARIVWDRTSGVLSGRPGALRLAVTSGGTIPDRGLYGVFLATDAATTAGPDDTAGGVVGDAPGGAATGSRARGGRRVGELDEEMVYESRVGDTFTLGSSTWRIEDITPDRVLVTPAPGAPGRLPFWKGDSPAARPSSAGPWVPGYASSRHWPRRAGRSRNVCGTRGSTRGPPTT
ncbi:DEAD/DEAH box helicase [Oerskovia sp. M15]